MGYSQRKLIGALFVAALAALPCLEARAGLVIDDFSDVGAPNPWPVSTTAPAVLPVMETGLTGAIGGTRLTTLSVFFFDIGGLDEVRTSVAPDLGVLDYQSTVGANGDLRVAYVGDFVADFSGDAMIQIDFAGFDLGAESPMPVTVTLWNGIDVASLTQVLTDPGPQSTMFAFSEFSNIENVDLSGIDTLLFEFDPGDGGDFRVGQIQSVVPEPATLVLLLVGAGAVVRRRRRDQ